MKLNRPYIHQYSLFSAAAVYFCFLLNQGIRDISRSIMRLDDQELSILSKNSIFAYASNPKEDIQDHYKTLGVQKTATKEEIHKAFRKLAKEYHPDRNKDKNAQDEFIKIFKAYETLSDEKKRRDYDSISASGFQQTHGFNPSDVDINEFFKQYEDHFFKHAQHHQDNHDNHHQQHHENHNRYHQKFMFNGVNFDDIFNDLDDEDFSSFGNMFHSFDTNHHDQGVGTHGSFFGDGASFFGNHFDSHHHSQHKSCQTITRYENGVMMQQTTCI